DGTENPTWMRIQEDTLLLPEKEVPISVEREGKRVDLKITPSKITRGGNTMGSIDLAPDVGVEPVVVGSIDPQMPAAASGIEKGDLIMSVNDKPVRNSQEMKSYVIAAKNTPIKLIVNRKGERKEITTTAKQKDGEWLIGIGFSNNFDSAFEPVGIAGAAGFAVDSNWRILRLTGKAFGQMFSGERSVKEGGVAGPIGIVQIISQVVRDSGFLGLLPLLMVISLNLGVFNLLPIPMLDGGQIAVLGIEAVLALFGMTLSIAIKEKIQLVGLGLILLLMVLVMYVDISRLIG
ncbi:MAG: site-2 protease family protein, partial [Gammaproteobacteria bacterium]|nr:site-2 protease family protein [Gammaproteobacteria bacterium]